MKIKSGALASTAILIVAILSASGCANRRYPTTKKAAAAPSTLEQRLSGVAMSADLSQSAKPATCDEEKARAAADADVVKKPERAPDLWSDCQEMYACSPMTADLVSSWFESGATFKLGFAELKAVSAPHLANNIGGLFIGGTTKIFLDNGIKTTKTACYILLHELVHRFDPTASTEESLRTEYRAYWHQTAYNDELLLHHPALAIVQQTDDVSTGAVQQFHTRESLLKAVADAYGFKYDPSILQHYGRLPREPKTPSSGELVDASTLPRDPSLF